MPDAGGWLSAWLLGASMGLTACTVTCLPFMGTWVLARGGAAALGDTGVFLAGRLAAYTALGLAAALAGTWLARTLAGGTGQLVIGGASLAAGLWLLRGPDGHRPCAAARAGGRLPPFALGLSLSLVPCAPLASLLAFAAQAGSPGQGAAYGLAFGLGAALTPLAVVLPLLGRFGERLRQGRAGLGLWLQRGAALVLVALGLNRIGLGI